MKLGGAEPIHHPERCELLRSHVHIAQCIQAPIRILPLGLFCRSHDVVIHQAASAFMVGVGGGSIEPLKTGGNVGGKGSIDRSQRGGRVQEVLRGFFGGSFMRSGWGIL